MGMAAFSRPLAKVRICRDRVYPCPLVLDTHKNDPTTFAGSLVRGGDSPFEWDTAGNIVPIAIPDQVKLNPEGTIEPTYEITEEKTRTS